MKRIIVLLVFLLLFGISFYYHEEISEFLVSTLSNQLKKSSTIDNNKYALSNNYKFVSLTNNFYPKNKHDIENIYYTIINSGMEDFTFYCDRSYVDCLDDINEISNDQKLLSHLNNYVHIFNSFRNIETEFDNLGKVKIHIIHNYTFEQIDALNNKMKEITSEIIKDEDSDEVKIKTFHDYVINNTKYDTKKSDNKINTYHSDIAYGALIEGYAVCGGYSDSMKLFLDNYKIPNFKVASENHIWNAVYINDKWLHLDLTWDDPVTLNSDKQTLTHKFYLIDTKALEAYQITDHEFNKTIYEELS